MRFFWVLSGLVALSMAGPASATQDDAGLTAWQSAWATAQALTPPRPVKLPPRPEGMPSPPTNALRPIPPIPPSFENQTVRMVVRPTIGGELLRIQFSNASGADPVRFAAVRIAKSLGDARIDPESDRRVTFSGEADVTIQPGAIAISDPVKIDVGALDLLAVSLHIEGKATALTVHPLGLRTTFIADGGMADAADLSGAATNRSYFWLTGLEMAAAKPGGTIIAFGDSITDGFGTTPDSGRAWPDRLAERLQARGDMTGWSVINMGISGNRLRREGAGASALARFDRDILARPGVRWVILLEGINDINMSVMPGAAATEDVTAEQMIAAYSQFVDRAHLHGIRVMGATIGPTGGLWLYGPESEAIRQRVNAWIRTGEKFDAVVDFDAALRDPARPTRLRPDFDPGDHVHPNDAGNAAMAEAIDLQSFGRR